MKDQLLFLRMTTNRQKNRQTIAEGVKGVKCVFAGSVAEAPRHIVQPRHLELCNEMLLPNETLGTCEVYANDAWNIFIKRGGMVIGLFRFRLLEGDNNGNGS